jgi:uncharacterized membrane protein required for colicin V production
VKGYHRSMSALAQTIAVPDLILLGLCALLGIRGAIKGFAWQLVRTIGLIAALWAATRFYEPVGGWLDARLPIPSMTAPWVGWIGVLAVVFLLFSYIAWVVKGAVKTINLGGLDRVLGFLLGGVMALLVGAAAFVMWGHYTGEDRLRAMLKDSYSARYMAEAVEVVTPLFPEEIRVRFRESLDALEAAGDASE